MLRALETSELEEWTNEEKVCDSVAEEVALKQAIERKGGGAGVLLCMRAYTKCKGPMTEHVSGIV